MGLLPNSCSEPNFHLPLGDVCTKLKQKQIGILAVNRLRANLDCERRENLSRGQAGDPDRVAGRIHDLIDVRRARLWG